MIRVIPAAKPARNGYAPMLILRNARGQLVGSRISRNETRDTIEAAKLAALVAAFGVAIEYPDMIRIG